jgi:hypothetical protein
VLRDLSRDLVKPEFLGRAASIANLEASQMRFVWKTARDEGIQALDAMGQAHGD